jgi:hypothetical protein
MPKAKTPGLLRVRKLADRSEGERVVRYDPETGERHLVNPATGEPESWPLAGVQIEGDPPQLTSASTSFVANAVAEGWIELVSERLEHRPGGPSNEPWRITHTFVHANALVIHTADGDVRYRVVHQPDKYAANGDDSTTVTPEIYAAGETRVDHFYGLELED